MKVTDLPSLARALPRSALARNRADQAADNRADCRHAERDPSGAMPTVVDVMNDRPKAMAMHCGLK